MRLLAESGGQKYPGENQNSRGKTDLGGNHGLCRFPRESAEWNPLQKIHPLEKINLDLRCGENSQKKNGISRLFLISPAPLLVAGLVCLDLWPGPPPTVSANPNFPAVLFWVVCDSFGKSGGMYAWRGAGLGGFLSVQLVVKIPAGGHPFQIWGRAGRLYTPFTSHLSSGAPTAVAVGPPFGFSLSLVRALGVMGAGPRNPVRRKAGGFFHDPVLKFGPALQSFPILRGPSGQSLVLGSSSAKGSQRIERGPLSRGPGPLKWEAFLPLAGRGAYFYGGGQFWRNHYGFRGHFFHTGRWGAGPFMSLMAFWVKRVGIL